jgi:hypothetical protein
MALWKKDENDMPDFETLKKAMQDACPSLLFEIEAYTHLMLVTLAAAPPDIAYSAIRDALRVISSFDDPYRRQIAYLFFLFPVVSAETLEDLDLDDRARAVIKVLHQIAHTSIADMLKVLECEPAITDVILRATKFALQDISESMMETPLDHQGWTKLIAIKTQFDLMTKMVSEGQAPDFDPLVVDEDKLDGSESSEGLAFQPNI